MRIHFYLINLHIKIRIIKEIFFISILQENVIFFFCLFVCLFLLNYRTPEKNPTEIIS